MASTGSAGDEVVTEVATDEAEYTMATPLADMGCLMDQKINRMGVAGPDEDERRESDRIDAGR